MNVVSRLGIVGVACNNDGNCVFLQKKKEINKSTILKCEAIFYEK